MKNFRPFFIVIALLICNLNHGQEEPTLSLDEGPIVNQFEYISKRSGNYRADGRRYEVVRVIHLDKLRGNVLDSINAMNTRAKELRATITSNETTINSLNEKLKQTTNSLTSVTEEKDSMSFFGMQISKGSYNFILWTIILGLTLLLLLFIYKFRNSNILTQEAKSALSDLELEYEQHRRRALEREQKINRELQDERNKQKKKST